MKLKQYLEPILLVFAIFTIILQYNEVAYSSRLTVMSMSVVALYYLLSGALVLFNKRVANAMRIIYSIGLWSIAVGLVGTISKLQFWPNAGIQLLLGFGIGIVVMIIVLTYRFTVNEASKSAVHDQLVPIFNRLLVFPILFLLVYFAPFDATYQSFGKYRDSEQYQEVLKQSLENPMDSTYRNQLKELEKELSDDN